MNLLRMSALVFLVLQLSCSNDLNSDAQHEQALLNDGPQEKSSPELEATDIHSVPARGFRGDLRHYSQDLAFNGASPQALQRHQVVWLSLDGSTIQEGDYSFSNAQDDISPIPEISRAVLPPLRRASFASALTPSSAIDAELRDAVLSHFSAYDIDIVTSRPTSGDYSTVVIGGTPASLGIENPNLLGIAPYDRQNQNANDIVFVFSQSLAESRYDLDALAITIVHELAHSFGLDHVEGENNIMAENICRCAQEFGAGPIVGRADGRIQRASNLLSSVFLARQTDEGVSCEDTRRPSVASSGSVLNEEEGCVDLSGQLRYWRSVSDSNALDNHYLWTGAIVRDNAVNAATFSLRFESTGSYDVEAFIPPDAQASEQALYLIEHNSGVDEVRINQRTSSGFVSLGQFDFETGRAYTLTIGDNTGEPSSSSMRVLVDSIRVVPAAPVDVPQTPDEEPETPNEDPQTPSDDPVSCESGNNHSFAAALALAESERARRCANLNDYYRFEGDPNCAYVVELEHRAEEGNLDLALFNSEGQSLASARTSNSIERVIQGGTGPMFAVVSAADESEASYELSLREFCREAASCPADDVYEPNDEPSAATPLYRNDAAVGIACNNDDLFKIETVNRCDTRILVEFDHAEGDLDIEVRSEAGEVLANGVSVTDNEEIRFRTQSEGELFLRVYGYSGAQADYRVELTQNCQ